jgi:hypothetical protein
MAEHSGTLLPIKNRRAPTVKTRVKSHLTRQHGGRRAVEPAVTLAADYLSRGRHPARQQQHFCRRARIRRRC